MDNPSGGGMGRLAGARALQGNFSPLFLCKIFKILIFF